MATVSSPRGVGPLLREWRRRRRRTQLELALDAGVSARHLSFIETGRSNPSREMVVLLADQLEVPFRETNQLLLAAGYAPLYPEESLDDPVLAPVREALDMILRGHEPYPGVVVDRYWNVVAANAAMAEVVPWVDQALLEPPLNAMRVGLHPRGFAQWIVNLGEVRAYFLGRLRRQVATTRDERLAALLEEVAGYAAPDQAHEPASADESAARILTPVIRIRAPDGRQLSVFATVATFGTALEVTTSELSIELAFPADAASAAALQDVSQASTLRRPGAGDGG